MKSKNLHFSQAELNISKTERAMLKLYRKAMPVKAEILYAIFLATCLIIVIN